MRICPKCGYHDTECWHYKRWTMFTSYAYKDWLKELDPKLYSKIVEAAKRKENYCDKYYRYHLTKVGYIHRIAHKDCKNLDNKNDMHEPDQEKTKRPCIDPKQYKIVNYTRISSSK